MLRSLVSYFRPPTIRERAELERFMSGEASYLAQRATYEFTRNTLAWFGQSAFADPGFNDQFRACRWETFALVLGGFATLGLARLRPAWRGPPETLANAMVDSVGRMLHAYPIPSHRPNWDTMTAELRARFAAPSLPGLEPLARLAAERAYEAAPARSANEVEDRKVILNAIHFGTIAFQDRWDRRVDLAATCTALTKESGGGT